MFPEKFVSASLIWVNDIDEWVRIFAETSGEDDDFIDFVHLPQELIDPRSDQHENVAETAFDFNGQDNVRRVDLLEGRVHERLVKVQHQRLLPDICAPLGTQQVILVFGEQGTRRVHCLLVVALLLYSILWYLAN